VCFRYIIANIRHKDDNKVNDDDNNNNIFVGSHDNGVMCLLKTKYSAVYFLSFIPKFYLVREILT
jgi:hypothetical protein